MTVIAFAGLGVMGAPMARHLIAAGHQLRLFNRTFAKTAQFVARHGGTACNTAAEAAQGAEVFICCVGNDEDVREVTVGAAGAFQTLAAGALVVDHTTASATVAREIAAAAPGLLVLDAPVSGGQAGAENGQLAIMCGGTPAAFAAAQPYLACYGRKVVHIGPSGHGQLAKMCNQIAIAGIIQSLAESLHFAGQAGLDTDALLQAIGGGAANSWQMDNRAQTMVEGQFDFGFAVDLMRKDFGIVLATAREIGASLPVAALVDQFYADLQRAGGGRADTSSLIRRLG